MQTRKEVKYYMDKVMSIEDFIGITALSKAALAYIENPSSLSGEVKDKLGYPYRDFVADGNCPKDAKGFKAYVFSLWKENLLIADGQSVA